MVVRVLCSYFIQINFCVMLSTDFVVTVPFVLSDALPSEENTLPPSYWVCLQKDARGSALGLR